MATHLDRARAVFGRDTGDLLAGGRYALLHTRSLDFDELRPYVPGDDVRDIDWKATARSGHTLTKRFVSEKHHKILVVADAGRNMSAVAPSGEFKRDIAANVIGALGLITLPRSDEIGMVFGDSSGCLDIRLRRGHTHVERMLARYHRHTTSRPATSDICVQLDWVAKHYRRPMLVVVVSDEPETGDRLSAALRALGGRHDVLWAMVSDMPAVGGPDTTGDGYDVATGRIIPADTLGPAVAAAYRDAEERRYRELADQLAAQGVWHIRVAASRGVREAITILSEMYRRAG